jgi:hypothetical protein
MDSIQSLLAFSHGLSEARLVSNPYAENPYDSSEVILTAAHLVSGDLSIDLSQDFESRESSLKQLIQSKTTEFLSRLHNRFARIHPRFDFVWKRLDSIEELFQKQLERQKEQLEQIVEKATGDRATRVAELSDEFARKETVLRRQLARAHEGDEKFLNDQLNEVSGRYREKLAKADKEIAERQQALQNLFTERHKAMQRHHIDRAGEERRAAAKHEQLSREHTDHKAELQQQSEKLEYSLAELEKAQEAEKGNAELKITRLAHGLITELSGARQAKEDELDRTGKIIQELTAQLAAIARDEDTLQAAIDASMFKERSQLTERMIQEGRKTDRAIEQIKEESEARVRETEDEAAAELARLEEQHTEDMNLLKNSLRQQSDFASNRMFLARDEYAKKLAAANAEAVEVQQAYETTLREKDKDLTTRRSAKLQSVGIVLSERDSSEKSRAQEVNDIMRQLEEQQNRLTRLHDESLRNHNAKRSEELAKLRKDHAERPARVLAELEKRAQLEYEEALRKLQEEEDARHEVTLNELLERIERTKSRIGQLQQKMDGVRDNTTDRIQDEAKDAGSQLSLREATGDGLNDEEFELVESLSGLSSSFEASWREVRQEDTLREQVTSQTEVIQRLSKVREEKKRQIEELEARLDKERAQYEEETRNAYEGDLRSQSKDRQVSEAQLRHLKLEFRQKVMDMESKIGAEKLKTAQIRHACEVKREQQLDEIRCMIETEAAERRKAFNANHGLVLGKFDSRRAELEAQTTIRLQEIREDVKQRRAECDASIEARIAGIDEERAELDKERAQIEEQLRADVERKCPLCDGKKEKIRLVLVRRDELLAHRESLLVENVETEASMEAIFQSDPRRGILEIHSPESVLRVSLPVSGRRIGRAMSKSGESKREIARPKTAASTRIWP